MKTAFSYDMGEGEYVKNRPTVQLQKCKPFISKIFYCDAERRGSGGGGRMRELLECPVCMEEMKPPKKIFQVEINSSLCPVQ